ncbi:MAG: hypothetical protein AAF088_08240 [Pseudomonadota bacterium]
MSQQRPRPALRFGQPLRFLHGRGQFRLQPLEDRCEGRSCVTSTATFTSAASIRAASTGWAG